MRSIRVRLDRARRTAILLALMIGLAASRAVAGGEFFIRVEAPSAWKDPRIKDAALVIRAFACGEPTTARITASAEGLVDGKRQTVPLKVAPAADGIYAIKREWPARGDWVVAISAAQQGIVCSKLVDLGPDGAIPANQETCLCPKCFPWRQAESLKINGESKLAVKTTFHRLTAREIDEQLKSLAAGR